MASSRTDPPDTPGRTPAASAAPVRGSVIGLRASLIVMAVFTLGCGLPTMNVAPELQYLGDTNPPMDAMHRSAVLFLVAAAIAFPVYVLAAIHVGFTARGRAYLPLAGLAFAIQAILNLFAQPFLGAIAMIPVAAGGIAAVIAASQFQVQDLLEKPTASKLHLWPDLVVIPVTVTLAAATITHFNRYFVPDEPNPPRTFDSSEGWEKLGAVVDVSIPVMEDVEGFRISHGPYYSGFESCDDGAAWDEEWVELHIKYRFGELEPDSDTNLAYMAALNASWTAAGYMITNDASAEAATGDPDEGYGVAAMTEDGIKAAYRVARGEAAMEIRSGCILKVGEINTFNPL